MVFFKLCMIALKRSSSLPVSSYRPETDSTSPIFSFGSGKNAMKDSSITYLIENTHVMRS